ncbi:MAG: adenylate/guanylate cyclase domain-containing protein [Fimbriimonadaceae bacterium]|nr:adenylate/guanylate cyclase domain-containing protein [Fimbriimonadaceae bacterium]
MVVEQSQIGGPPSDSIDLFATRLIETPGLINSQSAEGLAEEFGLEPAFVRELQSVLQPKVIKANRWESFWKSLGIALSQFWGILSGLVRRLTSSPISFPFASGYTALALLFFSGALSQRLSSAPNQLSGAILAGVNATIVAVVVAILILQLLCFARHGMARYPAYAALGVWGSFAVLLYFSLAAVRELPTAPLVVAVIVSGILAAGYFVFGVLASVIGASIRAQRESTEHERLTRQEILARLFELQAQFELVKHRATKGGGKQTWIHRLRAERNLPGLGLAVGVTLGLFQVGTLGTASRVLGQQSDGLDLLSLFVSIVSTLVMVVVGYVAGGVRRAFGVLIVVYLASLAIMFVPWGQYGAAYVEATVRNFEWVGSVLVASLIALVTGIGAKVDEHSAKRRRLKEGDPALLFAEITKLQWQLNRGSQDTCVMVVDVAKSTNMKLNADPLAIEYSFREYQKMVAEQTSEQGGTVISTAGDGVVASFPSVASALYAARSVQTAIFPFNEKFNRLQSPFRLRIGIHAGQTEAQLEEVPYNELIDIAAHVEAVAPVGGIAVTQAVADQAKDEFLAELKDQVDGQPIYIVMNPIL